LPPPRVGGLMSEPPFSFDSVCTADTENNRKPAGASGKWTSPDDIAKLVMLAMIMATTTTSTTSTNTSCHRRFHVGPASSSDAFSLHFALRSVAGAPEMLRPQVRSPQCDQLCTSPPPSQEHCTKFEQSCPPECGCTAPAPTYWCVRLQSNQPFITSRHSTPQ
jgi:hypothetical protein